VRSIVLGLLVLLGLTACRPKSPSYADRLAGAQRGYVPVRGPQHPKQLWRFQQKGVVIDRVLPMPSGKVFILA
jgi:hypothetical protein